MKKALLAIVLMMAALVPISLTASPASAAGCAGTVIQRTSTNYYAYGDGTWQVKAVANMQYCSTTTGDQYAKVSSYRVDITKLSSSCGQGTLPTFGHPVTGWRVNPDDLGAWNAAEKSGGTCTSGAFVFSPNGVVVWQNSGSSYTCIGGYVKPKLALTPDAGSQGPIPDICVF